MPASSSTSGDGGDARKARRQGGLQRVRRRLGRRRRPGERAVGRGAASGKPAPSIRAASPRLTPRRRAGGARGAGRARRLVGRVVEGGRPFHAALKARLGGGPGRREGVGRQRRFSVLARSLAYVLGGDLGEAAREQEPDPGHRPLPGPARQARRRLPVRARPDQGGDVPGARGDGARRRRRGVRAFAGQVANPFERKLLADLAASGVETVDLLPAFLAERAHDRRRKPRRSRSTRRRTRTGPLEGSSSRRGSSPSACGAIPGTGRSPRTGAAIARRTPRSRATAISARACPRPNRRATSRRRWSAIRSSPRTARCTTTIRESPIVLLGDSFTGVYQLMDCEHAGVSAHLAESSGRRSIWS